MTPPPWFRVNTDAFDHPKVQRALDAGGHGAVMLWMQGLAYSAKHLTDGWVPLAMPKRWSYTCKHTKALESAGLWIPLEITDDGGWLINNFTDYQPTRQEWEEKAAKRRAAARKRWAR